MSRTPGSPASSPVALRSLALVLALAPLVVLPAQLDFALLPQQAFIEAAALVLAALGLLGAGAVGLGRPALRGLDLPVLALLGWSAVSLAATGDREPGLRTLGHWTACAVVYLLVSRRARLVALPALARGALAGGAAAALVGLAQGWFSLAVVPQAAGPSATLANRDLAAGYLVSVLPLALVAGGGRRVRALAVAAAALILAFLPFTLSRAAVLALGLQALALGLAVAPRLRAWRWRTALALGGGLAVVAVVSVGLAGRDPAKARSLGVRRDLAVSALAMGLDRPLLGAGLGRFGALYPAYGPAVRGAAGEALRVEGPHDEPLQVFAETGLPGLLALLWLAAAALAGVLRLRRSGNPALRQPAMALGLCLIGLAADAAFSFPLRAAVPPLLAAVVLGLIAALQPAPASAVAPRDRAPARRQPWLAWAAGAAIAVALAGAVALSLLRLAGDHALHAMRVAERDGRWADALAAGRAALRLDPRPEVRLALARAELRLGHRAAAIALLERVLEARPFEATAHATLGVAREAAGDTAGAAASLRYARLLGVGPPVSIADEPLAAAGPGSAGCPAAVSLAVHTDGRVDLSARGALLADVLRCLSEATGLRLDYEGAPPRRTLTVARHGEPLAVVVEALFEGLGIDYVLGLDHSGRAERLIVVTPNANPAGAAASATASAVSRPGSVPVPTPRAAEPSGGFDQPAEDEPAENAPRMPGMVEPPGSPYPFPGGAGNSSRSPGGSPSRYPSTPIPDTVPEFRDPGQISPTVLQLGPGPGTVKTAGWAAPYAAVSADGT